MLKSTGNIKSLPSSPTSVIYTKPPSSPKSVIYTKPKGKSRRTRGGLLFPWKLQNMLGDRSTNEEGRESIVSWFPHGRTFKVHNVPAFVADVLPLFFKQTKLKSFQRQLNLWGFLRIQDGPEKGAYHHKHFLRDQPELACRLKRQKAGIKSKALSAATATATASATATTSSTMNTPETTSIPMESTTTKQRDMSITSLSTIIKPFTSRQVSIESTEKSNIISEKLNLHSTLSLITTTNENTMESTSMILKKSTKIEQEIKIALPSSNVHDRPTFTTREGTSLNGLPQEVFKQFEEYFNEVDVNCYDPLLGFEDIEEFPIYHHLEEEEQQLCEEEFDIKFKFTPTTETNQVQQKTFDLLEFLEEEENDFCILPAMSFDMSDM